jgi:hypothetical protein
MSALVVVADLVPVISSVRVNMEHLNVFHTPRVLGFVVPHRPVHQTQAVDSLLEMLSDVVSL